MAVRNWASRKSGRAPWDNKCCTTWRPPFWQASVQRVNYEGVLSQRNKNSIHISGVRPLASGRSTDTRPGETSRRVWTTVGFFRRAAAPRGLIDLTPQTVALDALRVKREISWWVVIALRMFRREMEITGAADASMETELNGGDK